MAGLNAALREIVDDRKITQREVEAIRNHIHADGRLDLEDVKCLVELLVSANEVCPEFDELFFPALKRVVLQDGRISQGEQYYLLKMIYGDGRIRESEKQFLCELREEAIEITPEFEALLDTAFEAHPTEWTVG